MLTLVMLALCLATFSATITAQLVLSAQHQLQSNYEIRQNNNNRQNSLLCTSGETNPFIRPQQPTCSVSVDKLVEGLAIPGIAERHGLVPPWMNHTLYRIGQLFAQENLVIISYCHYLGSIITFSDKDTADVFSTTGKSAARETSILVQLSNYKHAALWYEYDILSWDRISTTSIYKLRSVHSKVAKLLTDRINQKGSLFDPGMYANRTANEGLWTAVEADLQNSAIPSEWRRPSTSYSGSSVQFPQFVMSLAQLLFVGLPVIMPEISEITKATEEQLLGWNHLWGVLGFALGIEDEFNIALKPSLEAIVANYHDIFRTYIIKGFFSISKESKILMEIVAGISNEVFPSTYFSFSPAVIMHSILKELFGISTQNTRGYLNSTEKEMLDRWEDVKASLKASKQPLMSDLNNDYKRNFDTKGRLYFGSKYSNDATAAEYMFS